MFSQSLGRSGLFRHPVLPYFLTPSGTTPLKAFVYSSNSQYFVEIVTPILVRVTFFMQVDFPLLRSF